MKGRLFMLGLAIVGLCASLLLTNDIYLMKANPDVDLPCNINPFLSCKSVNTAWQGELLGFPNSIVGIAFFAVVIALNLNAIFREKRGWESVLRFIKAKNLPVDKALHILTLFAVLGVFWFVYQSIFVIGSLCIYCMIVWGVIWPMFVYYALLAHGAGFLRAFQSSGAKWMSYSVFYIIVLGLIMYRFSDFIFLLAT